MSRCRSCNALMRWARTEKGGKMPLDLQPFTGDDPGHVYVLRENGQLAVAAPPEAFPGEPVYRSHFRSCSDPERHSKRSRRS